MGRPILPHIKPQMGGNDFHIGMVEIGHAVLVIDFREGESAEG